MIDATSFTGLSPECRVTVPPQGARCDEYVSRWSKTRVSTPAAVVQPLSTDDIVAVIEYARQHSYKVLPAGGGHAPFVPIGGRTIYLDMQQFKSVNLDEDAGTVTFGAGVLTKAMLVALGEKGYYTSVPNSNAVGMVGYCLSGGNSPFNAWVGLAIDHILKVNIITAEGQHLEVGPGSTGDQLDLYNVLCGAGLGFGVVTSIKIRVWRIRELNMDEDKIWTRSLIFPPNEIATAAELFTKLQNPEPRLTTVLVFLRAPPNAPQPGAPMIMFGANFFGPSSGATSAAAAMFKDKFTSRAVVAQTGSLAMPNMDDSFDPLNRHGDFKEQYPAFVSSLTVETITTAFERWLSLGENAPEAKANSFLVFAAKGSKAMLEHDVEGKKFFPRSLRDRGILVQAVPWWTAEHAESVARKWATGIQALVNATQHDGREGGISSAEAKVTAFAACLSKGTDLETVYHPHQLEEIRRLKKMFDPENVFWNPVVDGV